MLVRSHNALGIIAWQEANFSPPTYHITATLSATPMSALNNYIITNDGAEFTINKRVATWTTDPNSKTYGDADPTPLTIGSGTNFVAADNVTATYSRVAGESASPPTYHITATLHATPDSALANYIITNDGAEFTIQKRLATWTTNPASKTYGDTDPSPLTTGSGSNFVAADNVTATYTRAAGENASPPTYHITATLHATPNSALANYIITNAGAEFTINKRAATWTTNAASKTYGDVDPSPLTTGSGTNFVAADNVTVTYTRVAGENASPPTYHITATLHATPDSALDNYIITNAGAEFTIDKRVATWTTNANSKTYGDADSSPLTTGSGTNFVAVDNVTATYTRAAGENASPPTYHITATLHATPSDSVLANYIITNDGAEFTINKRVATWTTNANSKTYGDADPNPLTTGSGSNFVAADNVTATYTRAAGENASPPTYHITAHLSATPMSALDNYIITNDGAEFTINKRVATWTTNANSKTYGDVDPSPLTTGSGTNFVAADNVTATYARAAGENASPPTYHITATLHATPDSALANYIITNDGAEFTINKRVATWTTNAASKIYGDSDPSPLTTGSGTNFVAGDNVAATYMRVAGENASPPTYHITATLSATPMSALDNYIITNDGAEFTINKRLATWTTNPNSKTYGDADPSPLTTGSGSNFVAADNVTATYTRVTGENASPPTYHITATLHATPMSALVNYIITNDGAEFTINPAPLDITASNQSKTYGDVFTFAGTEFSTGAGQIKNGDTVASATLTSAGAAATATVTAPGPNYTINISGAVFSPAGAGGNYSITYHTGNLHLNPKAASVTANSTSKTYAQTVTFAGTEFTSSGFINGDNVTSVTLMSAGAVATATVTAPGPNYPIVPSAAVGTGLGNYTIGYINGNLHINTASLTITATNVSKTYGVLYTPHPTPPSTDFSVSGLLNSDSVTSITLMSTGYPAVATIVGSPYTVTPSAALGTGLGNYTIGYVNGSLTVNKAHLTVTADAKSVQYSDRLPTLTATISGFVNGETETGLRMSGNLSGQPSFSTSAAITFYSTTGISNAPGTYTNAIIPSVGTLSAANYDFPVGNFVKGTLTVNQEDARPYYTGSLFVDTAGPNIYSATVTLSATIKDITAVPTDPAYDAYPGDIRNATVTFINRDNNTVIASNLPVGLVNSNDTTVGTVTYNWSVNLGNALSASYTIGIIVNNYYTRNSSFDNTVVTVSVPPAAGQITGGGYLVMQNSAGQYSGGVGTKNNFGFNVQNAHNGLHGNINTIIRNNGHTYQVKGNSMTSLTTGATTRPYTGTFNGKASIQDITDPLNPIGIDGNATLQVTMHDYGQPANDTIGITVWAHAGGLYFSSNWNGTTTVEQTLGGGNLQVH
jgi:hypothetical protein